jgi:hypothetical protein
MTFTHTSLYFSAGRVEYLALLGPLAIHQQNEMSAREPLRFASNHDIRYLVLNPPSLAASRFLKVLYYPQLRLEVLT